jgi:hypothetical protein
MTKNFRRFYYIFFHKLKELRAKAQLIWPIFFRRNYILKNRDIGSQGRSYDHNFRRFLPIFGENIANFFSKTNVMIKFLA